MGSIDWIGFVIASIAVALAPEPGSLFVAKTSAASGLRPAHAAMLGIMAGDTCLIVLSVLGLSALFHAYPSLFFILKLLGAGYLVFLGIRIITGKARLESPRPRDREHSFVRLLPD